MEFGRRAILRQEAWRIQDHYAVQASFWLPDDFREGTDALWLDLAGGNLVMPNVARVRVNGFPVDYRAEPARAKMHKWDQDRAWDYRIRLRFPLGVLQAGENSVLVSTHMLPGISRVMGVEDSSSMHNMSLAQIGVQLVPTRGAAGGP